MTGHCPRCRAVLELPESGLYECQKCHRAFEVFLARPREVAARATAVPERWTGAAVPAVAVPGSPAPAFSGPCAGHPNNAAVAVCERCGDFMCSVCETSVEGRHYCPRCFDLLFSRGSFHFTQRSFNMPTYAMMLGLLSVGSFVGLGCWGFFSLPAGIISVVLGVQALREIARREDLKGRGPAITGIVCGCIATVVTLAGWGWLLYTILSQ